MNKTKQTEIIYANGIRATYLMNLKRFKTCKKIDQDLYQIELFKKNTFSIYLYI